jgi:hypothetical protein
MWGGLIKITIQNEGVPLEHPLAMPLPYFSTKETLERNIYDPVLLRKYDQYGRGRGLSIADFARRGWADLCGGKILRNIELRIRINVKGDGGLVTHLKKRFYVDPQNPHWHAHLRADLCASVGQPRENYAFINLQLGKQSIESTAQGLDMIATAPFYQITVSFSPNRPQGDVLPAKPIYVVRPAVKFSPLKGTATVVVQTTSPAVSSSPDDQVSDKQARREAKELVEKIRILMSKSLPEVMDAEAPLDYEQLRDKLMDHLNSNVSQEYWDASKCPNIGEAITDLSSDVAGKVCKIGESLAGGENLTHEVYQSALIGCSIWDEWVCRYKRWLRHQRGKSRLVCPDLGAGFNDECLNRICAPMGAPTIQAISQKLIDDSLENSYQIGSKILSKRTQLLLSRTTSTVEDVSSDDKPTAESLQAARRKKHYRRRHHRGRREEKAEHKEEKKERKSKSPKRKSKSPKRKNVTLVPIDRKFGELSIPATDASGGFVSSPSATYDRLKPQDRTLNPIARAALLVASMYGTSEFKDVQRGVEQGDYLSMAKLAEDIIKAATSGAVPQSGTITYMSPITANDVTELLTELSKKGADFLRQEITEAAGQLSRVNVNIIPNPFNVKHTPESMLLRLFTAPKKLGGTAHPVTLIDDELGIGKKYGGGAGAAPHGISKHTPVTLVRKGVAMGGVPSTTDSRAELLEIAADLPLIECKACGGKDKKEEEGVSDIAAALASLPLIECGMCSSGAHQQQHIGGGGQGESPPAPKAEPPTMDVSRAPSVGQAYLSLLNDGTTVSSIGLGDLCFEVTAEQRTVLVPAGSYTVVLRDADGNEVSRFSDVKLFNRNHYALTLGDSVPFKLEVNNSYDKEKLSEEVRAKLAPLVVGKRGVLVLPIQAATITAANRYFADGDSRAILKQRSSPAQAVADDFERMMLGLPTAPASTTDGTALEFKTMGGLVVRRDDAQSKLLPSGTPILGTVRLNNDVAVLVVDAKEL